MEGIVAWYRGQPSYQQNCQKYRHSKVFRMDKQAESLLCNHAVIWRPG